jgi:copper(I)-binding protein
MPQGAVRAGDTDNPTVGPLLTVRLGIIAPMKNLTTVFATFLSALIATIASAGQAQTRVDEAWVRASVPHQPGTGVFMRITSAQGGKLIEARSPLAKVVEIHTMLMVGDVMKMRPIASLDLPAGQPVMLKPGSYHVMLTELTQPVMAGDKVPLTLVIEGRDGSRESIDIVATAIALASMPPHAMPDMTGKR